MTVDRQPTAIPPNPETEAFFAESLRELKDSGVPFLLAGTYAVSSYTGVNRPTKDIDVFCRAGDYTRILAWFHHRAGWEAVIEDERWLAKVRRGPFFFDVIFNSSAGTTPVDDRWFAGAPCAKLYGTEVCITPPTELVWSKVFVQDRTRFDGSDVLHLMLCQHDDIDWRRLLGYMEPYWEVLLIHVLNFRFVYPTERDRIPRWLFDELLARLQRRADLPAGQTRICRGRLYSRADYAIDIDQWGFADIIGGGGA